jgi:hypothetical protein
MKKKEINLKDRIYIVRNRTIILDALNSLKNDYTHGCKDDIDCPLCILCAKRANTFPSSGDCGKNCLWFIVQKQHCYKVMEMCLDNNINPMFVTLTDVRKHPEKYPKTATKRLEMLDEWIKVIKNVRIYKRTILK